MCYLGRYVILIIIPRITITIQPNLFGTDNFISNSCYLLTNVVTNKLL
jgi:hypothetical protein